VTHHVDNRSCIAQAELYPAFEQDIKMIGRVSLVWDNLSEISNTSMVKFLPMPIKKSDILIYMFSVPVEHQKLI
jgi:hypothetical protein